MAREWNSTSSTTGLLPRVLGSEPATPLSRRTVLNATWCWMDFQNAMNFQNSGTLSSDVGVIQVFSRAGLNSVGLEKPKEFSKIPRFLGNFKVGLGIFDFWAISCRLISKDSISSPNFNCGCSYAEHALWCRDSKRRALGNCFSVRICSEFLISKCRGDWDLGLCIFWVLAFINPLSDGKIWFFLRAKRVVVSEVAFAQRFSFCKYPKSAQTQITVSSTIWY